uniref:Uncharacterized protein n=1 Tax=Globisporangium ultimum (strain ATCC 200006 / CBS 805.95 / DAOM BR144) TaxID=431595 RepID=K3WID9_GLOUD
MPKDVWRLCKQFNDEDIESTNTITQTAFFYLIQEEKRSLTKTIFRLAHIPLSQPKLTFDEYLCCVCTFASFTEVELLKFFYEVYNEAGATGGTMGESDILKLGRELQDMNSAYAKNVTVLTKRMASNDLVSQQMLLTFQDFEWLSRQNKVAFYPLFRMQRNVRMGNLGEAYWVEKTREKLEIQQMLAFMAHHNGKQPAVDWKTKVLDIVFHRETSAVRVRRRAKLMYDAQYRQLRGLGK